MSFLDSIFGSKPIVPVLSSLNLSNEVGKTTATNQANLAGNEQLVNQANLFTQSQISQMLNQAIPGFNQIAGQTASNISSMVSGKIPSDVSAQILQSGAQSAIAGGVEGSGFSGNLTARDLGLNSLNIMQQGMGEAQSWEQSMNSLFAPGEMNLTSMFVSPEQQASFDVSERNTAFNRNWMANQISAMPDPVASGIFSTVMGAVSGGGGGGL